MNEILEKILKDLEKLVNPEPQEIIDFLNKENIKLIKESVLLIEEKREKYCDAINAINNAIEKLERSLMKPPSYPLLPTIPKEMPEEMFNFFKQNFNFKHEGRDYYSDDDIKRIYNQHYKTYQHKIYHDITNMLLISPPDRSNEYLDNKVDKVLENYYRTKDPEFDRGMKEWDRWQGMYGKDKSDERPLLEIIHEIFNDSKNKCSEYNWEMKAPDKSKPKGFGGIGSINLENLKGVHHDESLQRTNSGLNNLGGSKQIC